MPLKQLRGLGFRVTAIISPCHTSEGKKTGSGIHMSIYTTVSSDYLDNVDMDNKLCHDY